VKPVAICLNSSACNLERAAFWNVYDDRVRAAAVRNHVTLDCIVSTVDAHEFDILAKVSLSVEDGARALVSIKCDYDIHFECSTTADEDVVRKFAQTETRQLIWPYFREFVSTITARMGIPPVEIPLVVPSAATAW